MSLYGTFLTDPNLETQGVIFDYGDFRVTLAFAGPSNKVYARLAEGLLKPYRRAIETGTMDPEIAQEVMRKLYAKTVVRNWETAERDPLTGDVIKGEDGEVKSWKQGIENEEGKIIPFTEDNVIVTYRKLPHLFLDHQEMASKMANYRVKQKEDSAKN